MCRTGFKNGGLRERPLTGNGGFQNGPSWDKQGSLELKITKECIFFKTRKMRRFRRNKKFRSAQVGKAERKIVYFKRGYFGVAQVEKVRVFRSGQGRKRPKNGWLSRGTNPYCPYMRVPPPGVLMLKRTLIFMDWLLYHCLHILNNSLE